MQLHTLVLSNCLFKFYLIRYILIINFKESSEAINSLTNLIILQYYVIACDVAQTCRNKTKLDVSIARLKIIFMYCMSAYFTS